MFYSQAGQDKWVTEITNHKKGGFFLDIGAYDGVNYSNTYYLEKKLGWNGICVEPDPDSYKNLMDSRNCICENVAISNFKGLVPFNKSDMGSKIAEVSDVFVNCDTLENILIKNNAPRYIDYLSIDVEGKEIEVIENFPFSEWKFGLITIEHNLYCTGDRNKMEIMRILTNNGYELFSENVSHEGLPFEDWYIAKQI